MCGRPITNEEARRSEYQIEKRPLCPSCNVQYANKKITSASELKNESVKVAVITLILLLSGVILYFAGLLYEEYGKTILGILLAYGAGLYALMNAPIDAGCIVETLGLLLAPLYALIAEFILWVKVSDCNDEIERAKKVIDSHVGEYNEAVASMVKVEAPAAENGSDTFSKKEVDYIVMYKDYLSDGEISEKERARLSKYAEALGISPERAAELEKQ